MLGPRSGPGSTQNRPKAGGDAGGGGSGRSRRGDIGVYLETGGEMAKNFGEQSGAESQAESKYATIEGQLTTTPELWADYGFQDPGLGSKNRLFQSISEWVENQRRGILDKNKALGTL